MKATIRTPQSRRKKAKAEPWPPKELALPEQEDLLWTDATEQLEQLEEQERAVIKANRRFNEAAWEARQLIQHACDESQAT